MHHQVREGVHLGRGLEIVFFGGHGLGGRDHVLREARQLGLHRAANGIHYGPQLGHLLSVGGSFRLGGVSGRRRLLCQSASRRQNCCERQRQYDRFKSLPHDSSPRFSSLTRSQAYSRRQVSTSWLLNGGALIILQGLKPHSSQSLLRGGLSPHLLKKRRHQ